MDNTSTHWYPKGIKLIFIALFAILGLWFIHQTVGVLFLFFFAVVLTLVLNAPTMWLIKKGLPRTAAALITFIAMLLLLAGIGWLVVPKILDQLGRLAADMPSHIQNLKNQLSSHLSQYPSLQKSLANSANVDSSLLRHALGNLAQLSFSLIGGIFMIVVFLSLVAYMLIKPGPLIQIYLELFPADERQKATEALAQASNMMVGWIWSNVVVGAIESVAIWVFLYWMNVPGVWVWAGLAFFAEMVPKLGLYIMAIPPTLIALSIDPTTALWVAVFYLVLNELMGDLVSPKVRASTMNLHPVSTLFVMLAMGSAFGLGGALIATPLTAFIKAYYNTFYLSGMSKTVQNRMNKQVKSILERKTAQGD